ncbi:hypothetical protein SNE40_022136 [Patella caerulea]|uniref:Uncharacterized protein n=1 Tax=Patella caerulea TaxID=87958 RepID=A0AAN8J4F8_PATCE
MANHVLKRRHVFKECTLRIPADTKNVKAVEIIDKVENICGVNTVLACVPRLNKFEVTLDSNVSAGKLIEVGVEIGGLNVPCHYVSKVKIVSIMNLPYYIEDTDIEEKLTRWNVKLEGEIKERIDHSTGCADGTRIMKVIFPPGVSSLPFSVGFNTVDGYEYFALKINDQTKVCFNGLSTEHIKIDCSKFRCNLCDEQGNVERKCRSPKCEKCSSFMKFCECETNMEVKCTTCNLITCICNDQISDDLTRVKTTEQTPASDNDYNEDQSVSSVFTEPVENSSASGCNVETVYQDNHDK